MVTAGLFARTFRLLNQRCTTRAMAARFNILLITSKFHGCSEQVIRTFQIIMQCLSLLRSSFNKLVISSLVMVSTATTSEFMETMWLVSLRVQNGRQLPKIIDLKFLRFFFFFFVHTVTRNQNWSREYTVGSSNIAFLYQPPCKSPIVIIVSF